MFWIVDKCHIDSNQRCSIGCQYLTSDYRHQARETKRQTERQAWTLLLSTVRYTHFTKESTIFYVYRWRISAAKGRKFSLSCVIYRGLKRRFTSLIARRQAGKQPSSFRAWHYEIMKKTTKQRWRNIKAEKCTWADRLSLGSAVCSILCNTNTEAYRLLQCWSHRPLSPM